jgi:hypothetical protein
VAETHRGVWGRKNREIVLEDPEPVASARLFKHVSDGIWASRPRQFRLPFWSVVSVIPPNEVAATLNWTVSEIDESLVVGGGQRSLELSGMRSERAIVPGFRLRNPTSAAMVTFNRDEPQRAVIVNGQPRYVKFVDGHQDYARELDLKLNYEFGSEQAVISYSMWRHQQVQDLPISLMASVRYNDFAETGYESEPICSVELTPEQETSVLKIMAMVGGISLEHFEE